jgi:hypothetical protein
MPDPSELSPFLFPLEGGLVLDRSTFDMKPGMALELENFEPDIGGGYRRINGYTKWNSNVVPYTASSTEKVLMCAHLPYPTYTEVIGARGESVYRATSGSTTLSTSHTSVITTITVVSTSGFSTTGTLYVGTEQITYTGLTTTTFTGATRGANSTAAATHASADVITQFWTSLESGRTSAATYSFFRFNLAGTDNILWADGSNPASYYDGTTVTAVNGAGSPADPKYVTFFKDYAFYAGASATGQEVYFAAPFTIGDFTAANGAGSFLIDSKVTALVPFREDLYIFAEERIYKLTGTSLENFQVVPITRHIGCLNGKTIQEFAGDLIFLGPDGLRTIAGTAKIDDVELGTISRPVQKRFTGLGDTSEFTSLVVPGKTQYRIFFTNSAGVTGPLTKGIICSNNHPTIEFSETKGIQPSCTDTSQTSTAAYVLHGGFDGYVYQQEQGNTFDGVTIIGRYRSSDITMGDAGIRKAFQRVLINYAPEGVVNADLFLRYDYESPSIPRPAAYPFDSSKVVALYGTSLYGTATYGGQTNPLVRQLIEGSGFAVALRVIDTGVSAPYSLKGFQFEFEVAARR